MKRKNNLYKEIVSFSKALEIFDVIKNNYQRKEIYINLLNIRIVIY